MQALLCTTLLLTQASSNQLPQSAGFPVRPTLAPFLVDESDPRLPDSLGDCTSLVVPGDLDGDGAPELLVASETGLRLLGNDGNGHFLDLTRGRLDFPPAQGIGCLALGDVDGDGHLDLFTGSDGTAGVPDRLWRNSGQGAFLLVPGFPGGSAAGSPTHAAAFGDVDGDGDQDLVTVRGQGTHGTGFGGPNHLLINEGNGVFQPSLAFRSGPWNAGAAGFSTEGLVLADLNGDGALDIVFANADTGASSGNVGQENQLLMGTGTGTFVDHTYLLPGFQDNSSDVVALDLEGDGDLDLAFANSLLTVGGASSGDLLINQGGIQGGLHGHFLDEPTSGLEGGVGTQSAIRLSVTAGDIDLDQDPDLFLTVHALPPFGADHLLLANQLQAPFAPGIDLFARYRWFDPAESIAGEAALFDMDLDGDLDLVLTHCGGTAPNVPALQLFRNTRLP